MSLNDLRKNYLASLKSLDTEEHIDLAFYRPIGYMWACLARRLGVTPNVITVAAIFIGLGAAVAFYYNSLAVNLVGILLLVWANSFDSADGQLARMTGQYSRLGRILDGLCGDIWFAAIYIAIILREIATSPFFGAHSWVIIAMALVTAVCHARQAAMADYYRQLHLYIIKGESGSELESSTRLRRRLAETTGFWKRLTLKAYILYTASQEATTPQLQRLRRLIAARYPGGRLPERLRSDFRRQSLPLMKYTNILSFNWRTIVLFASLIAGQPWIYFAVELTVFNAILIYMVRSHERICRTMTENIENGLY
ncbi:MAG: CDP-alcohol phosphatidyltransferase family protein [Muribaculaceae bacterium]